MPETFQAGRYAVAILYEDNHLLCVVKPPNMPVQADISGDEDLFTALKGYIARKYDKPGAVYLGLVHRLDRPVGGVMVFAKTSKAASRLSENFRTHEQDRRYLAVVEGAIKAPLDLNDWLLKDKVTRSTSVVPEGTPGAKDARLTTSPVAERDGLTLTEARLYTGRSHQIRVQHAHAGHPLWGDQRYGHGVPGQQIALWAWELTLDHPTKHEPLRLTALPPKTGVWTLFREELESIDNGSRL